MPYVTTMQGEKNTYQVEFNCEALPFLGMDFKGSHLKGYEIHMGETVLTHSAAVTILMMESGATMIAEAKITGITLAELIFSGRSNQPVQVQDGYINETHHIFGTYCHGIFDNDDLRRAIINALRKRKGLETLPVQFRYRQYKESEFDRLADTVRKHFDMKKFYEVLG